MKVYSKSVVSVFSLLVVASVVLCKGGDEGICPEQLIKCMNGALTANGLSLDDVIEIQKAGTTGGEKAVVAKVEQIGKDKVCKFAAEAEDCLITIKSSCGKDRDHASMSDAMRKVREVLACH